MGALKSSWPLLAVLVLSGCAPAFLEDLNSAAPLAGQMTPAGTIGPFDYGSDLTSDDLKFLPAKPTTSLTAQSGFVITTSGGYQNVAFVSPDPSGGPPLQSTGVVSFSLVGSDPSYPLNEFDVITTTATTANLVVFKLSTAAPSLNQATLISATLPSGPITQPVPTETLTTLYTNTPNVIGAQVVPVAAPGTDTFNLMLTAGGSSFAEASFPLASSGTVFNATGGALAFNSLLSPLLPPGTTRLLVYSNAAGTLSYASVYSGTQWVCYQWSSTSATKLAGVTHRIDAVLTSGDLLSTEGGTLRLYDPSGNQVLNVSLGALKFCYEAYVGSVPYVFFSLALGNPHGDWMFSTYAIPTSSMRGLH